MTVPISVIIPTYNGANKISMLLNALAIQTEKNFELIIVVDGSTDNTVQIAKKFEDKFLHFRIYEQPNGGRSVSRNFGAGKASSNLFIFYDDDMIPVENSVAEHHRFHIQHTGILSGNPIENEESRKTDIQNYKAYLTKNWIKKYNQGLMQLQLENLFCTAANCSMSRELFFKLNGFNENISDAEDYDLAFRALQQSIPIFFDRTNRAIHNDAITCVSYIGRLRQYRAAHQKLTKMYSAMCDPKKMINVKFKHILYRFFAFAFIPRMIDRFNPFMVLPKIIRYNLYSIVIHALVTEYPEVRV